VTPEAAAAWTDDVLAALRDWSVAEQLRLSLYAYPIVNTLHIFGFAMLIGSILLVDFKLLGAFPQTPFAFFGRILEPAAIVGLAIAIVCGFLLFVVKPVDYSVNVAFLVKMGLIALGILNAIFQRFGPGWHLAVEGDAIAPRMRVQAALSLLIWIAALFAGRLIAFLE